MSDGCLCSVLSRVRSKPFVKIRVGNTYKLEIIKQINPTELKDIMVEVDSIIRRHLTPTISELSESEHKE